MTRSIATRTLAAILLLGLFAGGCGGDDGADGAARSTTSSMTGGTGAGGSTSTVPDDGYVIDEAVLRSAVDQSEEIFNGVSGVDDDDYRAIFVEACREVRSGSTAGRAPEATADLIASHIPDDHADRRFVPVALLATEVYLAGSSCGTDVPYATAVREALHPIANQAFIDATRGG